MRRPRQARRRRRGATMVETAICLPVVLMALFGVMEFGRVIMVRHALVTAAQVASRQALVETSTGTTADIQAAASAVLAPLQLKNLNIQVYQADATGKNIGSWNNAAFGQSIAVQINADYSPMTPAFGFM